MIGGKKKSVDIAKIFSKSFQLIKKHLFLQVPLKWHFVKLVHNGIKFGIIQAIGEGSKLLYHLAYIF